MTKTTFKKTIVVDFDGVLHWYRKGWQDGAIYDEPVPGSFDWLRMLLGPGAEEFEVCIYSSRSKDGAGVHAMGEWFIRHGLSVDELNQLKFPTQKPAAWITIDDRAFHFRGEFPTAEYMADFKAWTDPGEEEVHFDAKIIRIAAEDVTRGGAMGHGERLLRIADRLQGR